MDTTDLDPAMKNLPDAFAEGIPGIPDKVEPGITVAKPGPRSFLGLRRKRGKKEKNNSSTALSEAQETVVEEPASENLDDNSLTTHSDPEGAGLKSKLKKKGLTHVLSKYRPKIRRSPSAPTDMRSASSNNSDGTSLTSEDSLSLTLPPPTGGQLEASMGSTMSGYSTPMPLTSSGYATPMFFESTEELSTPEISHTESFGETEEDDHLQTGSSLATTPNTVYAAAVDKEAEQVSMSHTNGTDKSSSDEDLSHERANKASQEPTEQEQAAESQSSSTGNSMAQTSQVPKMLDIPSQVKGQDAIHFSELEDLIQSPESGLGSDASPVPIEEAQTKSLGLDPGKSHGDLASQEGAVLTSEAEAVNFPLSSSPSRIAASLAKLGMYPTTEPSVPVATTPTQDVPVPGERREYLYKVLVIGELGTGKTSIIKRYVHQFFSQHYRATIGVDFALKVIHWDPNTLIRLQLWDIAGQERFGNMTRVYYKEAVGAFIVFDVTRNATFEAITKWKQDLDSKVQLADGSPIPCVLLANKCDQPKEGLVQNSNKMDEFCKEQGFAGWFETSAKDNINIEDAAKFLISKILANDRWNSEESTDADKLALDAKTGDDPLKKSCC